MPDFVALLGVGQGGVLGQGDDVGGTVLALGDRLVELAEVVAVAALPPQAIAQFTLRSLRVQGDVVYITWSAGPELPLGTDTFVVRKGRIASQTFAMYALPVN